MKRMKALVASAAGVATVAAMALLPAATASAATTPWCNTSKVIQNMIIPYYSVTKTDNCELGTFVGSSRKPAVMTLQGAMNNCFGPSVLGKVYPLVVDGIFGTNTETALVAVQKKIGVSPDGEYGPMTRKAMHWENADSGTPCLADGGV
jgi:zinc D-Ala-D-Ala carboxypeptidase